MDVAAVSGPVTNGLASGSYSLAVVLACLVLAVGVAFLVFATWRQSSTDLPNDHAPARGLRGVVLGRACCARCPVIRDCLQWLGTALHLPGFGLGARDSLDTFCEEDEIEGLTYSQRMRQSRHHRQFGIVGVKTESVPIRSSAMSGYKWKKKWRDRREKSKQKRKLKHQERKRMRDDDPAAAAARARAGSIILPAIGAGLMGLGQSLQAGARRGSYLASNLFSKKGTVGQNSSAVVVGGRLATGPDASPSTSGGSFQQPASSRRQLSHQPGTIVEDEASETASQRDGEKKGGSSPTSAPTVVVVPPTVHETPSDPAVAPGASLAGSQKVEG